MTHVILNKMGQLGGLFVTLFAALLFSQAVYALDCVEKGTGTVIKPAIPIGQLAIPSNVPAGTKVWQSNDITVTAYCDNVLGSVTDQVWFYFNPLHQSLGQGLQLGVSYNGQDLETNSARLNTNTTPIRTGQNVTVTVTFRLYIKVTGNPPSSGYYVGADNFTVFQLDGSGGLNLWPGAKNLRYALSGLTGARFIACGADLVVSPASQIVNFGVFNRTLLQNTGNNISQPFSITAVKQGCLSNFSIQAEFTTTNPLIGNNAVDMRNGTKLTIYNDANQAIVYNQYANFAELNNVTQVTKGYTASLNSIAGQTVQLGQFDATAIVKINYY
ncbi:fimbrial protein [Yersinia massiliensis]|uniref:fimbrial protein n=1 Tax=Yersinia massiliensis TaxID=419257 RepID=UPI0003170A48|nr:fimbrial protein [Yersinia massiliensis]MCB5309174.1 fimbrial protein [Yersinia massiliensis]